MEEALQKLFEENAPVPNQTAQCLLGHIEMSVYKHQVSVDATVQHSRSKMVRMHASGCIPYKRNVLICIGLKFWAVS